MCRILVLLEGFEHSSRLKKYAKGQIDLHRNELNGYDCPKGNASFMIELIPSFLNWIWPHYDQIFL